jgi:chromatin assembly factor 1 subunit B
MDLEWSSDSNYLVSGSLDGTAIVWQIKGNKFQKVQTLEGHKKFVQGVAMHPLMKTIVTASSDATVRIYKNRKLKNQVQFYHKYTIKQREDHDTPETIEEPEPNQIDSTGVRPSAETKKKSHRLFLDDTEYSSFVRRMAFSPDGSMFLTTGSWYQDLKT